MKQQTFVVGMRELAKYHGKELTQDVLADYWRLVGQGLTDEEFTTAFESLKRAEWFPTPARILAAADRARGFENQSAIALLYRLVAGCDEAAPTGGSQYRLATVARRYGEAAARIFQAVGGAPAFLTALRSSEDEPFLRKAFFKAAEDLTRAEPETMEQLIAGVRAIEEKRRAALAAPRSTTLVPAKRKATRERAGARLVDGDRPPGHSGGEEVSPLRS